MVRVEFTGETLNSIDWIRGDALGLAFPVHPEALERAGADLLTQAFQAAGSLSRDNRVARITQFRQVSGGSTGKKVALSVEYADPSPELHSELFVKFSRDFSDEVRDRARGQMELEVLFALLSRDPQFPISVPKCYFSDFHHASGSGILITQRIAFGCNGIEPLYEKCLDYRMPDQLAHYRALVRSLARLAGSHKAGHLPATVEQYFPFAPEKLVVAQRAPLTPEQISERVGDYADYARAHPGLFPESIRDESFLQRFAREAPRFQSLLSSAQQVLQSKRDMIALCHWNAHVDNAWFWCGDSGELECGLMDWGNVSQMNLAMALWGCLSAAELPIWNDHLDELLDLFKQEFERCGGPPLQMAELKTHLTIYVAMMGLTWMLEVPKYTLSRIAGINQNTDRRDPLIENNERARTQLVILIAFLNLWRNSDMSALNDMLEKFSP